MTGFYYADDSWLHRLDPRSKLLCGAILTAMLFLIRGPGLLWLGLVLAVGALSAHVPARMWLTSLKPVLPVALLTLMFHAFWSEPPFFGPLSLTGVERGGLFAYRMFVLVLFAQLLTLTTSPVRLCEGLEKLLHPLGYLRVPVHDLALAASISLRFLPILSLELDRLVKAQIARGACIDQGPLHRRLPALLSVLVPLFVRAFRYADDLAQAMEARGFVAGAPRTRLNPLAWGRLDTGAVCAAALLWGAPLLWR